MAPINPTHDPTIRDTQSLPETPARIHTIDILRGIVMIILVLDHTKGYFHILITIGIALVSGHNLLAPIHIEGNGLPDFLGSMLQHNKQPTTGQSFILQPYPTLPWLGILCLGYCLGDLFSKETEEASRTMFLNLFGGGATLLFGILHTLNLSGGDPVSWARQHAAFNTVLSFLNTAKNQPSLLYILMIIGPALLFLSFFGRSLNLLTKPIAVFGRVPLFFYVIYIFIAHFLASAGGWTQGYPALATLAQTKSYVLWIGLLIALYPLCSWFERYKDEHSAQKRWLQYI